MTASQEKMIEANGVSLCTESTGELDSPPVLLVMGATASLAWWPDALVSTLARSGCRVIRYDHRDTGRSSTVAPGEATYRVDDMIADLWAVADGYGLDRFHLVGMSLGGLLSQIAALQKPDRLISMTLIATEPLDGCDRDVPPISPKFLKHFAQLVSLNWNNASDVTEFMLKSARLCSGSGLHFSEDEVRERIRRELERTDSIESAFNHSAVRGGEAYVGRMTEITTPTLVLQGDDDPIVALANGECLAERLPNAKLHILRGVGHELPTSRLPEIATELLDFLAEHQRTVDI